MPERVVVGLDGCPTGWVAVVLRDGRVDEVRVVAAIGDLLAGTSPAHVGVDMPVGLVDGPRDTDAAARALLPGRAASVFSTAARSVVEAFMDGTITSHAEATARNVAATGSGLSQQAWRLVPRIAEVDLLVAAGHDLREVHPELAFRVLAGEQLPRKRTWGGIEARRALLAGVGVVLPARFTGDDLAAPDDVVDAAVCAWVADALGGAGSTVTYPAEPTQHDRGRPIVITARPAPTTSVRTLAP